VLDSRDSLRASAASRPAVLASSGFVEHARPFSPPGPGQMHREKRSASRVLSEHRPSARTNRYPTRHARAHTGSIGQTRTPRPKPAGTPSGYVGYRRKTTRHPSLPENPLARQQREIHRVRFCRAKTDLRVLAALNPIRRAAKAAVTWVIWPS